MEIDWSWLGDADSILRTVISETVYRFEDSEAVCKLEEEEGDNEDT